MKDKGFKALYDLMDYGLKKINSVEEINKDGYKVALPDPEKFKPFGVFYYENSRVKSRDAYFENYPDAIAFCEFKNLQ